MTPAPVVAAPSADAAAKNKNLVTRIITAAVALPLVLFLIYQGGFWLGGLLAFAAGACASEYIFITMKQYRPIAWVVIGVAALMPLVPTWRPWEATGLIAGATGLVFFATWIWHLLNGPHGEAPQHSAHFLTAFAYGCGGLVALAALRNRPDGLWWMVATLTITWANDTSAYFFGRYLGKSKMYPEVSPNKTWEGFFGGFVGAIGGLFILRGFFFPALTPQDCVMLGVAGSLLGPAGDLCESMLKRSYGVKDSGWIIPGHGGMLDRIDALIFNAPMVLLYVQFVRTT